VLAPAGVQKNVVTRLNEAVRRVMAAQEVSDKFRALGAEPGASSPDAFRKIIADELTKWREVVRKANLKFD
jgi:tripartite-type tricarboxylate transporter receptor subunit TctC